MVNKSDLLQRCGLTTPDGAVIGAEAAYADAELLAMIERFSDLNDASFHAVRRAQKVKEGGAAYRRLWKEALSTHEERLRLERAICSVRAKTPLGAIARMQLWLDQEGDTDATGTVWDLPRAAIRDALTFLGRA